MSLDNNLIILYPELTTENFDPITGDIYLKDDGDGDVYIAKWEYAQSLPEGALVGKENNSYLSASAYWYTARQRDASNVLLDASFIKLREVRLGYSIPASVLKKMPFAKSANFGVILQNAWLIWATTKQWGIDPSELEVFYREGGQLSSTRQLGVNLRVTF